MNRLVDTHQITLCENCTAVVKVLMDGDGNRFCGRCKQPVKSLEQFNKKLDRMGYGVSVGKEGDDKTE